MNGKNSYLCFVDCHKSFDRVKHYRFTSVWCARIGEEINHKSLLKTSCSAVELSDGIIGDARQAPLKQLTSFKYLDNWTTEDARCEEDMRAGTEMAGAVFWQDK